MKRSLIVLLIGSLGSSLASVQNNRAQNNPAQTSTTQTRVATSFTVIEDLVRNVGGNRVTITNFVPRDGDAHTYQPSTRDVKSLAGAQLVFVNGLGLENWFQKLLKNAASNARVVTVSDGLPRRKLTVGESSIGKSSGQTDPHLWWDPVNVIGYTKAIQRALSTVDPAGKPVYASNATQYIRAWQALDTWTKLEVAKLPAANRKLVTNHDALGYFAARYGFTILGNVIPSFGTESEPSARETARLIDTLRRYQVRALFTENVIPPKLVQQVAAETGAKVAPPLYTDALGQVGSPGETLLKAFRYNVSTIVTALK